MAVDVFAPGRERGGNGVAHRFAARLCQLDQHRQIRAVKDAPVIRAAGAQRQVAGRPAEHVGHDHHALALVHGIGCGADFGLFRGAVIIGVDGDESRLAMSTKMGADVTLDYRECDVIEEVLKLSGGGVDVAIEALGTQQTFESCLRCLRPGGTLSSLGVYSGKLELPYEAIAAGLGDHRIVTTLCPGGKERMRRLINVVQSGRFDPTMLMTHKFSLEDIKDGYELFGNRQDGVLKVLITP